MKTFFLSPSNFGPKTGPILSGDFFFDLHLILGRKTDLDLGWKIFILVFIILKFSNFLVPPFRKSCVRYWSVLNKTKKKFVNKTSALLILRLSKPKRKYNCGTIKFDHNFSDIILSFKLIYYIHRLF